MNPVSMQNKKPLVSTEPAKIKRIVEQLFLRSPFRIVSHSGKESPAKLMRYSNPHLQVRHSLDQPDRILLVSTHNGYSFLLECQTIDHQEDISVLEPRRIFIRPTQRQEQRFQVPEPENADSNTANITNIFILDDFIKFFGTLNSERDRMVKISTAALYEILPENVGIDFYLRKSSHMPMRLRQLARFNRSIFAPSVKQTETWYSGPEYDFLPILEYEKIQRSENDKRTYHSEICVHLVYKGAITYGYIQVRSNTALSLGHYKVVEHIARQFEKDIEQNKALPINRSKCEILDISQHGIGFLHPPRKEIFQQYQNGETLVFDLNMPDGKLCTLTGRIKSGAILESNLRFGLEFPEQAPEQQSILNGYICELGMQSS